MRGRRRKIDTIHTDRFVLPAGPERDPRTSVTAPEQHGYRPARVPSMGHKVITGGRARPSIRYRTLRERDRCRGNGPHIDDCDLAPEELANDLLQRPDVAKPSQVVSPKHEYAFVLAGDGQRSNRPFVAGESERALYGGALAYVEHPPMVMPSSSALHSNRSAYGRPGDHPLSDTAIGRSVRPAVTPSHVESRAGTSGRGAARQPRKAGRSREATRPPSSPER